MSDSVQKSETVQARGETRANSTRNSSEQLTFTPLNLTFDEAVGIGSSLTRLNKGYGHIIDTSTFDEYKQTLLRSGRFDKKQVEGMSRGAVMVALADVFADAKVASPSAEWVNDKARYQAAQEGIAQAKILKGKLDEKNVQKLLTVDDWELEEGFGPNTVGAAQARRAAQGARGAFIRGARRIVRGARGLAREILEEPRVVEGEVIQPGEERPGETIDAAVRRLFRESWELIEVDNQGKADIPNNQRWDEIKQEFDQIASSQRVEILYPAIRAFESEVLLHESAELADEERLNLIAPLRNELLLAKGRLDSEFEGKISNLGINGRKELLDDIAIAAQRSVSAIRYGYLTEDPEILVPRVALIQNLSKVRSGYEGVRLWYAYKQLEQFRPTLELNRRSEIQLDPEDNIRAIYSSMRFFEQSGSTEDFRLARERVQRLLEAVTASNIADSRKTELIKHVESFKRVTPVLITNQVSEGQPENIREVAKENLGDKLGDEALHFQYDRFREVRDRFGRLYLTNDAAGKRQAWINTHTGRVIFWDIDDKKFYQNKPEPSQDQAQGNETVVEKALEQTEENEGQVFAQFKDHLGKSEKVGDYSPLNMLSEFENAILYNYEVDRFHMNIVEELQKGRLTDKKADGSEDNPQALSAKRRIELQLIAELRKVAKEWNENNPDALVPIGNANNITIDEINKIWLTTGDRVEDLNIMPTWAVKNFVLFNWFTQNTLLGTTGVNAEKRTSNIDDKLEKIMKGGNTDENDKTAGFNRLRKELSAAGIHESRIEALFADYETFWALTRNAYSLAKFKFTDGFDGLKVLVYKENKDEIFQAPSLWGAETPMFARATSHNLDFLISERQGDPEVNKILKRKVNEKFGGYLGPQNQSVIRYIGLPRVLPAPMRDSMNKLIREQSKKEGVEQMEVDGQVRAREIYKGWDPTESEDITNERALFKINWAEASKFIRGADHIIDLYDDRTNWLKWTMDPKAGIRGWSLHPFQDETFVLVENAYSLRHPRRHALAELFLEAEYEVGTKLWTEHFNYEKEMSNAMFEALVNRFEEKNFISKDRGEKIKDQVISSGVERFSKQLEQFLSQSVKEIGKGLPGEFFKAIADFFKRWLEYLSGFLQGK